MSFTDKLVKNALISEQLYKLSAEEKQEAVKKLLENRTQRGLAKELGIPYATIHDWVSGRQQNKGRDIHISFNTFYRKIESITVDDVKDWGRLKMIREKIEELERIKSHS